MLSVASKEKAAQKAIWDCQSHSWFEKVDQLTITELVEEVMTGTGIWRLHNNQGIWKVRPASRISKSSCLLPRILGKKTGNRRRRIRRGNLESFLNEIWLWLPLQMMGPKRNFSDLDDSFAAKVRFQSSSWLEWKKMSFLLVVRLRIQMS